MEGWRRQRKDRIKGEGKEENETGLGGRRKEIKAKRMEDI